MPRQSRKRTRSTTDALSPAASPDQVVTLGELSPDSSLQSSEETLEDESTSSRASQKSEYVDEQLEELEPPPQLKKLKKLLIRTKRKGTMLYDWTQIGVNTYQEYAELAKSAAMQISSKLFLDEAGTILLCTPFLNTDMKGLGHVDKQEGSKEREAKSDKPHEVRSACTRRLGPVCFNYLGEWKDLDLIGNFEKELKPKLEAAGRTHKQDILTRVHLRRKFVLTPGTSEGTIRDEFKMGCLDRLSSLLDMAGETITTPPEVNPTKIRGGAVANYTSFVRADLCMVAGEDDMNYFPLLPVEVKAHLMDHLVRSLRHHYFLQRGGEEPEETATKGERTQCVGVMTAVLQCCLAFGMDEIVLWDGVTATAIKFDLLDQKEGKRRFQRRKDTMGKNDFAETMGEIGFWSRTTSYKSHDLPVSYMMAAMAWRQLKMVNNTKAYDKRRELIKQTSDHLYLSEEMTSEVEWKLEQVTLDDCGNREKHKGKRQRTIGERWGGSAAGKHVAKLEFEPIQDEDCLQRVLRMQKEEYRDLFPNVKSEAESVVVKIFDVYNVEGYYDAHRENDFYDLPLGELMEDCRKRYRVEVDCYKRISLYNSMNQRKINVPEVLDFGFCCFADDCGGSIFGLYLVMEDLGECVAPPENNETKQMIEEQLSLHRHIGITHGDVAPRNMTIKDGRLYFYDFDRATLTESHSIFV